MKAMIMFLGFLSFLGGAQAEQTAGEAVKAEAKTARRKIKRGMHKAEEKMCGKLTGDSKAECLAKAAHNRVEEAVDAAKDNASEIKDKVDN